ncbi:MAG: class I SAM-dependent methyltransferase, partial [Acidobacteriota bacterium]|nr:class I SAM-dependent methyltransferase [Acidobacteriota bacterium]
QWSIDYLHIDGDHSYEGSRQDFFDYKPLVAPGGIVTFHDTNGFQLPCMHTLNDIRADGHDVVEFPDAGAGFALVRLKK